MLPAGLPGVRCEGSRMRVPVDRRGQPGRGRQAHCLGHRVVNIDLRYAAERWSHNVGHIRCDHEGRREMSWAVPASPTPRRLHHAMWCGGVLRRGPGPQTFGMQAWITELTPLSFLERSAEVHPDKV